MCAEIASELKETPAAYMTGCRFPKLYDPRYPVHGIADRLEPFVAAIVDRVHPQKIILFGSYAYGQPSEHSDVDLLVIRRGFRCEKESNMAIREAFDSVPGKRFSFTILSKTPERIANRLAVKSPFYEDIVGKGVVLYAAASD